MRRIPSRVADWGGGTRIGESLQTFNRWHAARVLHSRSCVMIVSDGYDTGDPALLGREMAQLRRRCRLPSLRPLGRPIGHPTKK